MALFNNYWFRWFAGGFLLGSAVTALLKVTDEFKDLRVEFPRGRTVFTDNSAWIVLGITLGLSTAILGISAGSTAKLLSKTRR